MAIRGEVEAADFGDQRLSARLVQVAERLARSPDQSFPKAAGSTAALEATYRFLGNEAVTPDAVIEPHLAATRDRCDQEQLVFVAHDSTEFRFSSEREGLGRVAGDETYGFLGHFALAVSAGNRAPLGVLGMAPVFRERGKRSSAGMASRTRTSRPLEEKESGRWLALVRQVAAGLHEGTTAIHVMDREADAYELLAAMSAERLRFVVRLQFDRAVDDALGRGAI